MTSLMGFLCSKIVSDVLSKGRPIEGIFMGNMFDKHDHASFKDEHIWAEEKWSNPLEDTSGDLWETGQIMEFWMEQLYWSGSFCSNQ